MTRHKSPVFAVAVLALSLVPTLALHGEDGRRISETDFFDFVWIADPQLAPDGTSVAFVRVTADRKHDRYDTSIWMASADGPNEPRRLTAGPRDVAPRWSPDGRWLAFVRAPERDGRPQPPQIHLLPTSGGEARSLTSLPRGAGAPAWSPDSRRLAFTSTTTDDDVAEKKSQDEKKPQESEKKEPERKSDVRVITRAVYRFNGVGYLDASRHTHIWTIDLPAPGQDPGQPRQITRGEFDETTPAWSADGTRIFFTSDRRAEPYYELSDRDLYVVPASGGEASRIASIDGVIGEYALDASGKRIAFVGRARGKAERSYDQPDLFVTDVDGRAAPKNLTAAYDFDIGGGLTADQHAPRGGQSVRPMWSADGQSVVIGAAAHCRANLVRVDVTSGNVLPVTRGDQEVVSASSFPQADAIIALLSAPTIIGDLYRVDAKVGKVGKRLTDVNKELFSRIAVTSPEEFWYTTLDGKSVQAWIQKPPDFDPSKKYPLILEIHGGPHAAYGETFTHEFQWMAAKGYVVVYPNPRGSTSYGQEFGNIIQYRYPGDDYKDLMAAVDEVVKRGYIDASRMGVTGGSGGGLLTNWVITQTNRFAAAVSQRSISDWEGFWYSADFTLFRPTWFRAAPWQDPADFAARSPITHVKNVKTPLMLIEGEEDYRTPPNEGGEQMFRALKYLKVPTVMVRFPDENHELSRSGKPWHRVERLRHIVGWFDKYLMGKESTEY